MTYQEDKKAEEETQKFFRKKYGFFWKRKVKPSIECDEYYNKFKGFLGASKTSKEKGK